MNTKAFAFLAIAAILSGVGCGVDDESPAACSANVRRVACPSGFPAGQSICTDATGQSVSGCQISATVSCVAVCQK